MVAQEARRAGVVGRNEYPDRPVPCVSALVFRDAAVLLVKRRNEPNRGAWSPPGGSLELGETVEGAAARETFEETGVTIRPVRVVDVRNFVRRRTDGRVQWHYVLLNVLSEYVAGEPFPASDAENARFIPLAALAEYDLTSSAREVLERAASARAPDGQE